MPSSALNSISFRMTLPCYYYSLPHLDQLQRLLARPLDHRRARRAERIRLLQHHHSLGAQPRQPRIQIGNTQRDVVLQLPARTDQWRLALVRVPGQHHIAEFDPGARRAEHSLALECRPGAILTARHLAVSLGGRRSEARTHRRVEVLL